MRSARTILLALLLGGCGRTAPSAREAPREASIDAEHWWEGEWAYDPDGLAAEDDFAALTPAAQGLARQLLEGAAGDYRLTVTADRVVRVVDAQRLDAAYRLEGGDAERATLRLDDGEVLVLERTAPDRARTPSASPKNPALPLRRTE